MGYVEEACIVALLSAYIHLADAQLTAAYQISVMVPNFTENVDATVVCKVNNTELNAVNCPLSVFPITRLRIILSDDPPSTPVLTGTEMCDFSSFLTCTHGPPVSALECGCYHDGGDIYTVNVTVRADRAVHENKTIDCRPDCVKARYQYGLVNSVNGVPVVFETITTTTISTTTISTTTSSTPPTSISHSITSTVSSSSVTNITSTSGTTDHSQSGTTVHFSSAATDHLPSNTTVKSLLSNTIPISNTSDDTAIIVGASYGGLVIVTSGIVIVILKFRQREIIK